MVGVFVFLHPSRTQEKNFALTLLSRALCLCRVELVPTTLLPSPRVHPPRCRPQRPLPEATVSNTGQLPPEVLVAIRTDCTDPEVGGGRRAGDPRVAHLTLDLDTLQPGPGEGEFRSNKARQGESSARPSEGIGGAGGGQGEGEGEGEDERTEEGEDTFAPPPGAYASPMARGKSRAGGGLSESTALPSVKGGRGTSVGGVGAAERTRLALQLWWPLLAGLAGGAGDDRLDCRAAALSTLRDLLKARYCYY